MATILDSVDVHSPEHGKLFKIDVVEGLDIAHLDYIERQWKPLIKKQFDKALLQYFLLPLQQQTENSFRKILDKLGIPDAHWDWGRKNAIAPASNRKLYGLINSGHVEAVMMLLFGNVSREPTPGLPLVYVDYVAVAPWNRFAIQRPERFRGLGTVMLGTAVEVSRVNNFDGRCGLHSVISAEDFYRKSGMKEFEIDTNYHDMRYFEFSAELAQKFKS